MAKKKVSTEPTMSDVLAAISGLTQVVSSLVQQKSVQVEYTDTADDVVINVEHKKRGRPKKTTQSSTSKSVKHSPTLPFKPRINLFDNAPEKDAHKEEIDKRKWEPTTRGGKRQIDVTCVRCGKMDLIRPDALPPNQEYKCNNCVGKK